MLASYWKPRVGPTELALVLVGRHAYGPPLFVYLLFSPYMTPLVAVDKFSFPSYGAQDYRYSHRYRIILSCY